MLTDLSFLSEGRAFPPGSERERLEGYGRNEELFLTRQPEVWREDFARLSRLLRKSDREVATIFNYHQLLSKKTADFVCGEPPGIETERNADPLLRLLRKQDFFTKLYECFIDVSRFGNGVLKVVGRRLSAVSPRHWFPVVDPADLKHVTHHVIAYPAMPDGNGNPAELYCEVHTPGTVEIRRYEFSPGDGKRQKGAGVGKAAGSSGSKNTNSSEGVVGVLIRSETLETGLEGFAVTALSNVTHSGSIYGLDDYEIINSLVRQIMWRLHCADTVLDKHSEPSISGQASALEQDAASGIWLFKAGNYFVRESGDDPDVSYVTWDGNLDATFGELETLFNQLYVLSEMGATFMEGWKAGSADSGTALKLRLVSPRIKARRLVGINDAAVRTVIAALGAVNGVSIDSDTMQLIWRDGLPDDPVEDARRRSVETGGKPTKSQYSAIKERGLSDFETEAEIRQLVREQELLGGENHVVELD